MGAWICIIVGLIIVVSIVFIVSWHQITHQNSNVSYDEIMKEARQNDEELLNLINEEEAEEDDEEEEDDIEI